MEYNRHLPGGFSAGETTTHMNKTIWKFELTLSTTFVQMPKGAEILTVQSQHDAPQLWALVDPAQPREGRCIEIFGTGHPIPCDMGVERKYIATYQVLGGLYVFHAFERIN